LALICRQLYGQFALYALPFAVRQIQVCTVASITPEAAQRLDRGDLVEVGIDHRLQRLAGGARRKSSSRLSSSLTSISSALPLPPVMVCSLPEPKGG
jgi:hypothetical protein